MKNMKKLFAVLVAVLMIAASMSALAATGDALETAENKVTVTGLADGDTAKFFQIIQWVGNEEDVTPASARTNVAGWKATSTFASVLTKDALTAILIGDTANGVEPTGITSEIAGQLAKLATGDPTKTINVGSDGKAEYTPCAAGTYLVLVDPADANTLYNPVFVSADYFEGKNEWAVSNAASYGDTSAAKKSTLKLEKTATTSEDNWDDKKPGTTAIGDTVTFNVETTIPGYGKVYETPKFTMTDSLEYLVLDQDSVTITEPAGLVKDTHYTLTPSASGYTIDFKPAYLKTLTTPTTVKVTYTAKVSTDAPKNVNLEKNTVDITYSHDPSNQTDYDVKRDTTQHYTFTIDASSLAGSSSASGKKGSEIIKVGVDAAGNPISSTVNTWSEITTSHGQTSPLGGAHFKLYTDAGCNNEYIPKKADGTNGTALDITSDGAGRMEIKGLDAGTYYLKETQAPTGFIKNPDPVKIEIIATMKTVTITETVGTKEVSYQTEVLDSYTVKINDQEAATHTFMHESNSTEIKWSDEGVTELPSSIVNVKGTELPSTGGIGTTLFYIGGAVLVMGAVVVMITRRRVRG